MTRLASYQLVTLCCMLAEADKREIILIAEKKREMSMAKVKLFHYLSCSLPDAISKEEIQFQMNSYSRRSAIRKCSRTIRR